MAAHDVNTTYQRRPLDMMMGPPSITRSGQDIQAPYFDASDSFARLFGSADTRERHVFVSSFTPWLKDVLSSIAEFRRVREGWDGIDSVVPSQGALDSAEMLAVHLKDAAQRLVFTVDPLGRPTFLSNADDFYVHLTVDAPGRLTLFAEVDGSEHFFDNIEFNGRKAPDELASIL